MLLLMAFDGKLQIYDGILLLSFYAFFIYILHKRKDIERKDIEATCETKIGFPLAFYHHLLL